MATPSSSSVNVICVQLGTFGIVLLVHGHGCSPKERMGHLITHSGRSSYLPQGLLEMAADSYLQLGSDVTINRSRN